MPAKRAPSARTPETVRKLAAPGTALRVDIQARDLTVVAPASVEPGAERPGIIG